MILCLKISGLKVLQYNFSILLIVSIIMKFVLWISKLFCMWRYILIDTSIMCLFADLQASFAGLLSCFFFSDFALLIALLSWASCFQLAFSLALLSQALHLALSSLILLALLTRILCAREREKKGHRRWGVCVLWMLLANFIFFIIFWMLQRSTWQWC